jgi:hypothetical protein
LAEIKPIGQSFAGMGQRHKIIKISVDGYYATQQSPFLYLSQFPIANWAEVSENRSQEYVAEHCTCPDHTSAVICRP